MQREAGGLKRLPTDYVELLQLARGGYNGAPRISGRTMMSEVRGSRGYEEDPRHPAEDIVQQMATDAVLAAIVDCVREMYKTTEAKVLQNA